jgi:hypothetical protein
MSRSPELATVDRSLAGDVVRVLTDVAAGSPREVSGHEARRVAVRLERETGCSREDYRALWERPETSFGPFEDLPEALQDALRAAVVREMEERRLAAGPRLRPGVPAPVFRVGSELSRVGRWIRSRGSGWRRIGRGVYLCGRGLCWLSERVRRAWLDVTRFSPLAEVPPLHALWAWAGVDPMRPAIRYVRGIPCDPAATPVYRDTRRNVEAWMMVGLDLLPSDGDLYYVEANVNPGFMMGRHKKYPEEDPLVAMMIDRARSRGQDRLVLFPSSVTCIGRKLETIWRRQARTAGIELEVRDDPRRRSPYRRPFDPVMCPEAEDTLYLNVRTLHHPLCVLLGEKGLFEDEVARHNRRAPSEERIPVPRRIRTPADVPPTSPDARFPNVIVKDPLLDEARAIWPYRVSSLDEDVLGPPNVAFEFVPPDLEELTQNGMSGEYGIKFRVNVVITPDGPRVVETVKATGGAPVPERLEEGPVGDLRPYVINSHVDGSEYFDASEEEHRRVAPAALRIGRLVHEALDRLHGPDGP